MHDAAPVAEREIRGMGGKPAFKGYRGFPGTLCVSLNEEIVHGIPSRDRVIKDGDLVSLDLGAIVGGLYGDAAITVAVGEVPDALRKLLEVGEAGLYAGIAQSLSGNRVGDVSHAIQKEIDRRGDYGVVRVRGHRDHGDPAVPR